MSKKALFGLLSVAMVLSMILAACQPAGSGCH